jgi:hypothetical protein
VARLMELWKSGQADRRNTRKAYFAPEPTFLHMANSLEYFHSSEMLNMKAP